MRVPLVGEIVLLARVLSRRPPGERRALAASILDETTAAACHLRQTGAPHPRFGDGSLMDRCRRLHPPPEPFGDDRQFLGSLVVAARAVLDHSAR
jgi:hypothetical protein